MSSVRVASVGLGWWGKELACAASTAGIELATCFARTPKSRDEFAAEFGCGVASTLNEVLEDESIDGLLIATSHASHREMIERAATAGKHVFVEKPLALTVDDARACVEAADHVGVILQVGFQRRRLPAHRKLKEMIQEGTLGDVEMLEANHSLPNRIPDGAWRWDQEESPLGSMTSLGIHQIENFHYLVGPIDRVGAVRRRGREVSIDEAAGMVFEFSSGAVGTLLSSFFTPWRISLAVYGTEGAGYSDRDGSSLHFQRSGESDADVVPLDPVDAVSDQLVEFAECIRSGGTPEVGGAEGFAVVAVLEAAGRSADSGEFETVASI